MAELAFSTQPGAAGPAARRLYLLFRIGGDRYALDAGEVIEVLGLRALKQVPGAPLWVAGMLDRRGAPVPVIDMSELAGQGAAARVTSTRLALVHYRPAATAAATVATAATATATTTATAAASGAADHVLGLILEHATETLHYDPAAFQPSSLDNPDARYLGPVLSDAQGMVQAVRVNDLLAPSVRAMLYPAAPVGEARP
ncbi:MULTISPECIES: chemotaxis protein CheW [Achromobacter]|uniref:Chemotaxis protein CheW n=1 Tax=Achromobacter spanius TaxID=217203 RepID=A0ABY8GYP1_9BURK|nr:MULTISPECIES: chemotaxis protein CheW [Achromobacter]WAI81105.1 chemotaxis protein CheW [Achromobacter spanius]WEX96623.1 chemotaxis protein CheW [Achromobacter sp. SS2-2022]WFP09661.1 chemotaxis protein CheW [Achromobacter spanius]